MTGRQISSGLTAFRADASGSASNSTSAPVLFPPLESSIPPLDTGDGYREIIKIEKELVDCLRKTAQSGDPLHLVGDTSILPSELIHESKKVAKTKVDLLKRLKDLPAEEAEDEEEPEDEEEEDEEQAAVEDEEDDAGGDYMMSHFDNGEGYEDNDDEGDGEGHDM